MPRRPRRRIRRKRRKPNYVLRALLILLLLIIAVYFFLQSSTFNVQNIAVVGNKEVPADEIVRLSGIKLGSNIFTIKDAPVISMLTTNPLIADVKVVDRYPSTVELHIKERKAVALVPTENGMLYVDQEGYGLKEKRELSVLELPIITGIVVPSSFPLGKKITSTSLAMGLEVVKQIDEQLKSRITEINVKNNYISLYLNDRAQIRIGTPERLKEKIALFDSIVKEEAKKKSTSPIEYIDVSFEGAPVIKYKEN